MSLLPILDQPSAAQKKVKEAVWNLEHVDSVAELMALMESDVRANSAKAKTTARSKAGKRTTVLA